MDETREERKERVAIPNRAVRRRATRSSDSARNNTHKDKHTRTSDEAELVHVEEELAAHAEPFVNVVRSVQVRVVHEALPPHRGARLLEVDAHDNEELALVEHLEATQPQRVLTARVNVVDRAWPDDDDEAVVRTAEDPVHTRARLVNVVCHVARQRQLVDEQGGRRDGRDVLDPDVIDLGGEVP